MSPWRIRCRWCTCRAAACTRRASSCAARSRSSASWPAPCSAPTTRCRGKSFNADYDRIRDAIAAVVPGCADYNRGCASPTASSCRTRRATPANSPPPPARPTSRSNPLEWVPVPAGRLVLQTLRSHDQYNTTIYGLDDRYRGVKGGRRVVFVNPADIEAFGLADGARVDLVSEFTGADGELQERRAKDFLVVPYSTPVGNAAAYYPETNPLVPLDHVAAKSNTPVSKAVVIRLETAAVERARVDRMGRVTARRRPATHRRRGHHAPRRWPSRSRWRSGSTARRSRSRCAPRLRYRTGPRLSAHRGCHRPAATTC